MSEIIGLPTIVSTRHRIVIDKTLRELYRIPENGSVLISVNKRYLQIFPSESNMPGTVKKDISIGRFNLPIEWATNIHIRVGDRVFLTAASDCILVCLSKNS